MEEKLLKDLYASCEKVKLLTGEGSTRLRNNLEKDGALKTAKRLMQSGRESDTFALLAEKGLLAHSVEAVLVKNAYGSLFTDEEVDNCLARLVEAGFYG